MSPPALCQARCYGQCKSFLVVQLNGPDGWVQETLANPPWTVGQASPGSRMDIHRTQTAANRETKGLSSQRFSLQSAYHLGINQFAAAVDSHFRVSPAQLNRRSVLKVKGPSSH